MFSYVVISSTFVLKYFAFNPNCIPGLVTVAAILLICFARQTNRGDASWPSGQQQQLAVQQGSYMQSRAEAIQNLESTANELAGLFKHLSTMVSQQGDVAIRLALYLATFFCLNS